MDETSGGRFRDHEQPSATASVRGGATRARRRSVLWRRIAAVFVVTWSGSALVAHGTLLSIHPSVTQAADARPSVRFRELGGDVFAWSQSVSGTGHCTAIQIARNGKVLRIPVRLTRDGFHASVPLRPGRNRLVARCKQERGGTTQSAPVVYTERLQPRPTARITVSITGRTVILDGSTSIRGEPDRLPITMYTWLPDGEDAALLRASGEQTLLTHAMRGKRIQVTAPRSDGTYLVTLQVTDRAGHDDRSTTVISVRGGHPHSVNVDTAVPPWLDRSTVYAANIQLFGKQGFRSVEGRLPYLKHLGINTIWLWPPTMQTLKGEEYGVTDYFGIASQYGTKAQLRSFIQKAHHLGIRVILDFVPNHTSIKHPYFLNAQKFGRRSHYWSFYDRNADGRYTYYFDWKQLPNLNYNDPQVRRMMLDAFAYWVRDFDVDGFRVDAAWAIKERRPGFWPVWRHELSRIKPDLFLLAEAAASDSYYFSHGFNVGYDWSGLGQWAWHGVFNSLVVAVWNFTPALTNEYQGYPKGARILRFLNNNDTGDRFISVHGPGMTKVAAAMEFLVPGIPLIFTGDEFGAKYSPYYDTSPIPFKDRYGLLPWYRQLTALKSSLPALRSSRWEEVETGGAHAFGFVRWAGPKDAPALVVLNFGTADVLHLELGKVARKLLATHHLSDRLSDREIQFPANGRVTLRMPTYSVSVFLPRA